MIYHSNLACPDLTPHFKHLTVRPMPHSFGHSVPSDWADKADDDPVFGIYKRCGLWTHDEAAILWNVATNKWPLHGVWVDIGAHSGWTSRHVNDATNSMVICVEPMFQVAEFRRRFLQNAQWPLSWMRPSYSDDFFDALPSGELARGFVIDGCHEPGQPERDAMNAAAHLADTGVIIFHDFIGLPVRNAVQLLMQQGFKARVYFTPHMIGLCWRGDFFPPDHVPDPNLPDLKARCPEFPFERCL